MSTVRATGAAGPAVPWPGRDRTADVVVSGGTVTRARTEVILHDARRVAAAADDLAHAVVRSDAAAYVLRWAHAGPAGADPLGAGTFVRGADVLDPDRAWHDAHLAAARERALADACAARAAVRALHEAVAAIADRMERAARRYDATDAAVARRMGAAGQVLLTATTIVSPYLAVQALLLAGGGSVVRHGLDGDGWELGYAASALGEAEEPVVRGLAPYVAIGGAAATVATGHLPAVPRGDPQGAADALRPLLAGGRARSADAPVVTEVAGGGREVPVARDLAGALATVDPVYGTRSARIPDGAVAVQRHEGPDGAVRWLVTVPGTQAGDGSTRGWSQNLDLMSHDREVREGADSVQVVLASMRLAGIGPQEEVMLVGHSQGGMAAAVVAGMAASGFAVRRLVVAGTPLGAYDVPRDVRVTSLDVAGEWVEGLDGRDPTPSPNHVTITGRAQPDGGGGALLPHGMGFHERLLADASRLGDPALEDQLAGTEEFLAGRAGPTRVFEGHLVPREDDP
ncbi:hypothetical protein [Cellulomonas sp. PhB143]|uniref:hypothetical protein n=1 Tax=Cellulomonas sp. PhB143 TaxID=2485186 RepID=UPI0011CD7A5E|nr:hypothetical protein [Cellulomonas sp. PhB143]